MRPPYSIYAMLAIEPRALQCSVSTVPKEMQLFYCILSQGFTPPSMLASNLQTSSCLSLLSAGMIAICPYSTSSLYFCFQNKNTEPVVSGHRDSTRSILVRRRVRPVTRVRLTQLPHKHDAESPTGGDLSLEPPPGCCDLSWIPSLQGGGRVNC